MYPVRPILRRIQDFGQMQETDRRPNRKRGCWRPSHQPPP
jgi:hypothetical protein